MGLDLAEDGSAQLDFTLSELAGDTVALRFAASASDLALDSQRRHPILSVNGLHGERLREDSLFCDQRHILGGIWKRCIVAVKLHLQYGHSHVLGGRSYCNWFKNLLIWRSGRLRLDDFFEVLLDFGDLTADVAVALAELVGWRAVLCEHTSYVRWGRN